MEETQYRMEKESLYVPMPKEVDHHAAKRMSREIDFLIDSWRVERVIFDFEETEFLDSSVIGILVGRTKTMEVRHGEVCAIHLGERAKQIFLKAGLDRIVHTDCCPAGR